MTLIALRDLIAGLEFLTLTESVLCIEPELAGLEEGKWSLLPDVPQLSDAIAAFIGQQEDAKSDVSNASVYEEINPEAITDMTPPRPPQLPTVSPLDNPEAIKRAAAFKVESMFAGRPVTEIPLTQLEQEVLQSVGPNYSTIVHALLVGSRPAEYVCHIIRLFSVVTQLLQLSTIIFNFYFIVISLLLLY